MTSRNLRFLFASLFAASLFSASAFAQGSKMTSPYDPIKEEDEDRPDKRAEWMSRGREAPAGKSAAALRLRAHQQKMAMRAQREAAAARAGIALPDAPAATGWVGLGPAPLVSDSNFYGMVSGRATSVAIDPNDTSGNTVYVGGAYGGVWKSNNAAATLASNVVWTPVTDQQASLAVGAVTVQPSGSLNPVVLVGTGEPNNAIDSYYGVGILRSTDGGGSWNLIPTANSGSLSFAGLGFAKFAWSAANTNTVVAATATTAKGFDEGKITGSTNRGLYYSTDAGATWTYVTPKDGTTAISPISVTDVVYDAATGIFYAAIRYHGLYSSNDGQTWTRLANQPTSLSFANCPTSTNQNTCPMFRGQLAAVPGRDELYFWFIDSNITDQGIWRSVNGGAWTQISENGLTNCGDPGPSCGATQGFYNLEIAALQSGSGTDLYVGAVNLFKCTLTNNQATQCSQGNWLNLTHVYGCPSIASVHPDEHGLDFKVANGKAIMYFANDGGIYRALDGYTGLHTGTCGNINQFDDLNGTIGSMTQFVSFSVHPTDQNTVVGGTQDNGSPATNAATTNPQWITVLGGDGGYNAINPTTSTQWFAANTDVSIQVCNSGISCTSGTFSPVVTAGTATIGGDHGAFYTPYILDPQNVGELLVGTCRVWQGSTTGTGFNTLSVNFDAGSNTICTGGEINLTRGLAAGGPKNGSGFSSVVYATTEGTGPNGSLAGGEIWVTTSAGSTQMSNVTGSTNPSFYTISSVAIDGSDSSGKTAYVGIMGFVGNSGTHVWQTKNAGQTWTAFGGVSTGLPDAPVNALLVDSSVTPAQIYAGTDVGVFVSSNSSPAWTEVGPAPGPGVTGYLPNVAVSAIRLFNSGETKKLRVSTYGRGVWEFNLIATPDFTNVISNTPQTVFVDQTATFNGKLTAVNGYNKTVTLSCTGTTPGTCSFTPSSTITPTAGGASYAVSLPAGSTATNYSFNVHATDGALTRDAAVTLQVADMSAPNPNTVTAPQGLTSNATTFTVSGGTGFSGTVGLACSGQPTGATCNFSPSNAVTPPQTATLTVSTTGSTPQGSSTVTITATAPGGATKTQTFTLQVTAPPDFTWTTSGSTSHTVLAGQTTLAYDFTATPTGAATFAAPVTFSCSFSPSDPTLTNSSCSFTPTSIAAGAGATAVQMTIKSAGPNKGTGSTRTRPRRIADNRSHLPWLPLALPIAGVLFAGIARRRGSKHAAIVSVCVSLALMGLLVACGGGSSSPPPPPPITVTVSPSAVSLYASETGNAWDPKLTQQQFAAVVGPPGTSQTVTWAVQGSSSNGTIDTNTGLYTAPSAVPNPSAVTITATAQAGGTPGNGRVNILTPTTLGTFTVTVTAMEGAISHSQQVSLTVQ